MPWFRRGAATAAALVCLFLAQQAAAVQTRPCDFWG